MTKITWQSSPNLSKLPNELLHLIFECCHVSAHFNLARTCRRLADCGKPFLMRHDAAYRENGVVSDLEPLTIPNLLQKVLHDPYVAWNVRSIEIWVARDSWDSWGSVAVEVPESVANTVQPSIGQTAYRYEWEDVFENKIENPQELPDEQLEVYIGLLRKYAHFEQNDLDEAREEFSIGADYFYKIWFILICPRLNCLKHANVYDTLIAAEWMSNELFWWLSRIISRSRDKQSWAPGLESLKNVVLGVETGLWFQTDKHKRLYPSSVFRSVMMLPKLKSVYFGKFNMYSDIDELPEYPTPQYRGMIGSSSVEYIFLDQLDHNLGKEEEEEIFSFLLVPKSLKSLTVRGNVNELNELAKYITMLQLGRSLESLIKYSDDGVWGLYRPINMTQTLKRLSRTTIDVWAFLTEIFECDGYVITDYGMRKTWEDLERRQKCLSRLKDAFPKNSEVLLFQGGQSKRGGGQTIDAATLEEILIQLVQCKEQYPALKVIGIQQHREDLDERVFSEYCFSRLVEACWENGVDAYVRGNTRPRRHQLDMPRPPTLSSFRGAEAQNVDISRMLNPFTGEYIEREVAGGGSNEG